MSNTPQTEAMRLAAVLDSDEFDLSVSGRKSAAAELRRLDAIEQRYNEMMANPCQEWDGKAYMQAIANLRARLAKATEEPTGMPELPEPDLLIDADLDSDAPYRACSVDLMRTYGEQCWKAGCKHGAWSDKPAVNQQLTAELDEREAFANDTKDAKRYRWLRDVAPTLENRAPHVTQYPGQSFDKTTYLDATKVGLDAAIDAAMAKGVKG